MNRGSHRLGPGTNRHRLPRIAIDINPEANETERAAISAVFAGADDHASEAERSAWLRAAILEAVGANEPYDSEPFL